MAGVPETARRIGEEFRALTQRHLVHPAGHAHPTSPAGWLYLKHRRWLVFFRPHPDGIEIMRVVDATRDVPATLAEYPRDD
jgi:plasmid stabilization system protein ParE